MQVGVVPGFTRLLCLFFVEHLRPSLISHVEFLVALRKPRARCHLLKLFLRACADYIVSYYLNLNVTATTEPAARTAIGMYPQRSVYIRRYRDRPIKAAVGPNL